MIINFDMLKTFYSAIVNKMKGFRGNWNQNDPTADDYIKGRTHWAEERVLVEEITIEIDEDGGYVENPFSIDLVVGKEYVVVFNGTKYNCTCYADEWDDILIGNASIWGYEGGNGEPFLISNYDGRTDINTVYSGIYTLTILEENVHKLDEKYLPDMPGSVSKDDKIDVVWTPDDSSDCYSTMTYDQIIEKLGSRPVTDLNIVMPCSSTKDKTDTIMYPVLVIVNRYYNYSSVEAHFIEYRNSAYYMKQYRLSPLNGRLVVMVSEKTM